MKLSDERIAEFNSRMNDWISKQGLIFQLTHGGTGLGGRPPIVGSLIRFASSILFLTLLGILTYGGFLIWKGTGKDLPRKLAIGISEGLGVEKVRPGGFKRSNSSSAYFSDIFAEGHRDTFFNSLAAKDIRFKMSLLDGLFGQWEANTLSIGEARIIIKGGAPDNASAKQSWDSLFRTRPSFEFSEIKTQKASLTWGYNSPATWGTIFDSNLVAQRIESGWSLKFNGGFFSQGVLRDFEIREINALLHKDKGLEISSATLKKGAGELTFNGHLTEGGARPLLKFTGQFTNLPIEAFIPPGLLSMINGSINGTFTATGSINDADGICFAAQIQPSPDKGIHFSHDLRIFRMLSALDSKHSYRKLIYHSGGFKMITKGSELSFNDIDLKALKADGEELFSRLQGSFDARPITESDVEKLRLQTFVSSTTSETIGASPELQFDFENEILRQFKELQFETPIHGLQLVTKDRNNEDVKKKHIDIRPRRKFRAPFILDGQVELSIPNSAFTNQVQLPGVTKMPTETNNPLATISIELDSLIKRTSQNLADQWDNALQANE